MTGYLALYIILGYFAILITISYFTSKNSSDESFYTGDKQSPWYLVAFGMIGATLSGITFISIPGSVYANGMNYMPMVIGFLFGYIVVAYVLIPLYYRLNLTSIYTYLQERYGNSAFKTGASFFLLSRIIGATLRLYLVAEVLDVFLFQPVGIPYALGVIVTILLIWVYTFKSGIKTIVWTDTLQTAAILLAAGATIYFMIDERQLDFNGVTDLVANSTMFDFGGGATEQKNVWLSLINGVFFAIVMTGLDQDMMQKNLTCKNTKEAQKNIMWFSVVLIPINFIFLCLGLLIFETYGATGDLVATVVDGAPDFKLNVGGEMTSVKGDGIYPTLAQSGYFPTWLSATFLIGLIAAAYSSADSALTSLTTSFCYDILEKKDKETRTLVHIGMSIVLFLVIMIFKWMEEDSIVWKLFKWTGFTYGPLLGLFAFGILTKIKVKDFFIPFITIVSAISSYFISAYFVMGAEIVIVNGAITALGLLAFREGKVRKVTGVRKDSLS